MGKNINAEGKVTLMPNWNIIVPDALDKAVEEVVKSGRFQSKAEFIRTAVREKLEKLGFTNSRLTHV